MNRSIMKILAAAVLAAVLALSSIGSAGAHPADPPDCDGESWAVVAAVGDAAMAELIASWQVLDTDCVVAPADVSLIGDHDVIVLGGTKAVPSSAVRSLNVVKRIAGADRVDTARKVLQWIDSRSWATSADDSADDTWSVSVATERTDGYSRPSGSHGGSCPTGQDLDHVVALAEAWQSGLDNLAAFNRDSRNHYCLPASVNRSKGSSEPHEWLSKPKAGEYFRANPDVFCVLVNIWADVKEATGMTADQTEYAFVSDKLSGDCA